MTAVVGRAFCEADGATFVIAHADFFPNPFDGATFSITATGKPLRIDLRKLMEPREAEVKSEWGRLFSFFLAATVSTGQPFW